MTVIKRNTICDIYAEFYKTNYVFPLASRGMAAKLAFEYIVENKKFDDVVIPDNFTELIAKAVLKANLNTRVCPISEHDFGMDSRALNDIDAQLIYVRDAYGVASSYCAGAQGRYTIEDALDSPFSLFTGTGNIFYTSVPGLDDLSVLMTHDEDVANWLKREVTDFTLPVSMETTVLEQLNKRDEILLNQIHTAHTFLKLLPSSVRTANILCHNFSSIPLLLPKATNQLIQSSNTGQYLFTLESLNSEKHKNVVIVKFLDTGLNTVAGLAQRITSYINSDITGE